MNVKVLRLADHTDFKELKFVLHPFLVVKISIVIRNLIRSQALLLNVVVLDLVKPSINLSSVIQNTIYVAMKICATITRMALVLDENIIDSKKPINYIPYACYL